MQQRHTFVLERTTLVLASTLALTTLVPCAPVQAQETEQKEKTEQKETTEQKESTQQEVTAPPLAATTTGTPPASIPPPGINSLGINTPNNGFGKRSGLSLGLNNTTNGLTSGANGVNGRKLPGFLGKVLQDMSFSGQGRLVLRNNSVSGSTDATQLFSYQNNGDFFNQRKVGPFQSSVDMNLTGTLFGVIKTGAHLNNNRFATSASQPYSLEYAYPKEKDGSNPVRTRITVGNLTSGLTGNSLVSFNRQLQGVFFQRNLSKYSNLYTVATYTKAAVRRGSFQGNGTSGPYLLNANQILPGSVTLLLNGQELKPGEDYEIYEELGQINFIKGRILGREDTVEFTYEAQNYNTQSGLLTGTRYETALPTRKGLGLANLGVTLLRQQPSAQRTRTGNVVERQPISTNVNERYFILGRIATGTNIEVRYLERLLIESKDGSPGDYIFNRESNFIQLRTPLPADTSLTGTSSLSISYIPAAPLGVTSNRQLLGLDGTIRLPYNGNVNVQLGQSNGTDGNPGGIGAIVTSRFEGTGKTQIRRKKPATPLATVETPAASTIVTPSLPSIETRFTPKWNLQFGVNDIGKNFSGIDSTSSAFLRAEKGLKSSFSYTLTPEFDFDTRLNKGRILSSTSSTTTSTSGTNTTGLWTDSADQSLSLRYHPLSAPRYIPQFTFSRNSRTNTNPATTLIGGSSSTFTQDSLEARWNFGQKLSFSNTLARTRSKGNSVFATGYTNSVGTNLNTTGSGVLGEIRDTTGSTLTNSSSDSSRFALTYTPRENLSITSTLNLSRITNISSQSSSINNNNKSNARDNGISITFSPIQNNRREQNLSLYLTLNDSTNGQSTIGTTSAINSLNTGGTSLGNGQRTKTRNIRADWREGSHLSLQLDYLQSLSLIPGYDNTDNTTITSSIGWSPQQKLQFLANVSRNSNTYVGNQGSSHNTTYLLQSQVGPFGRSRLVAALQQLDFANTGGGSSTSFASYQQGGKNGTLSTRFDYQLKTLSPFLQWDYLNTSAPFRSSDTTNGTSGTSSILGSSQSTGQTNYDQGTLRLGADYKLGDIFVITLDTRIIRQHDKDNAKYSYHARIFNLELGLRF